MIFFGAEQYYYYEASLRRTLIRFVQYSAMHKLTLKYIVSFTQIIGNLDKTPLNATIPLHIDFYMFYSIKKWVVVLVRC